MGKTSILFRFVFNKFDKASMPTLGAGFKTKVVTFKDPKGSGEDKTMKLTLWDTAGQEKFDSLTKMYFKDAKAAIIVYDISNEQSFEKAERWVKDLQDQEVSDQTAIMKFLVANK